MMEDTFNGWQSSDERQPLSECLRLKKTFDRRQPLMQGNIKGRQLSEEDDLQLKKTINRQPFIDKGSPFDN